MQDIALIIDTPLIRGHFDGLLETVAQRNGLYQWYPANGVEYVWRDADLVKIAEAGLLPEDVGIVILAVHVPNILSRVERAFGSRGFAQHNEPEADAERARAAILDHWATLVDQWGVWEQPALDPQLETFTDWVTTTRAAMPATQPVTRPQPYQDFRRNQELYGNLQGRRQREAASTRAVREEAARQEQLSKIFQINWYATDVWAAPATDNSGTIWHYPIKQMQDQHLWDTIIWLVRQAQALYALYVPHTNREASPGLASKTWLVQQPIFRALLVEAITRQITFPPDIFRFLRQYAMAKRDNSLRETRPWNDPGAAYQLGQLDDFLHQEITEEMGKDLRRIDIDE